MSKLNEDIIIRYLENRCSEEDLVLINEWMKESDENAGESVSYTHLWDSSSGVQKHSANAF